jgi:ribosomal protein L37E|eukprot:COSAG02_NODE_9507_length_2194_cov_2.879634_3_plen_230_part_00
MLPGHGKAGPSRELDHLQCRKCGEDLFDFSHATGGGNQPDDPSIKKTFGLLRPAGLGGKVQSTGLRGAGGGQHGAVPAPLVGGEEIALQSGVTTGPSDPSEPGYAGPHKQPTHQTILGRKMQVHHLKNPHGREFEVVTVTNLTSYKTHGPKVAEHSWFPGYSWQIIVCARCGHHIGWRFDRLDSQPPPAAAEQESPEDQPAAFFFGILPSEALIESTALKSKLVTHGDL